MLLPNLVVVVVVIIILVIVSPVVVEVVVANINVSFFHPIGNDLDHLMVVRI